ncbi:hypothetical protein DL768_006584 [Monosporascus sp. mg162]|nr:hypothetical protein DL768_006584 [Monosporascus sp. mg162]
MRFKRTCARGSPTVTEPFPPPTFSSKVPTSTTPRPPHITCTPPATTHDDCAGDLYRDHDGDRGRNADGDRLAVRGASGRPGPHGKSPKSAPGNGSKTAAFPHLHLLSQRATDRDNQNGDASTIADLGPENSAYYLSSPQGSSPRACCETCHFGIESCVQAYWFSYQGCIVNRATNAVAGTGHHMTGSWPVGTFEGLTYGPDARPVSRSTRNTAGPCGQSYTNF